MMQLLYFVPLIAWLIFLKVSYEQGDRPVSFGWLALLAGLGTFECAKGFFGLFNNAPSFPMALGAGLLATGVILVARSRRMYAKSEAVAG
jgi:hypothetical protein